MRPASAPHRLCVGVEPFGREEDRGTPLGDHDGGVPLTAGIRQWLRCDEGGYLMTGPDLVATDRARW